jgi:3-hydroxybutyryl-CoA dehydrogenase
VDETTARRSIDGIVRRLDRLVEKGKMTDEEHDDAVSRLCVDAGPEAMDECDLVIEAIVERLDVKAAAFRELIPSLRHDAILASNTSSLSITKLGEAIGEPSRVVGMHFFNPAPLMKLVEVVAGEATDSAVADRVAGIARQWGKIVARANDAPGFIVNHVARPYYLEAFRILEDGYAGVAEIDEAMRDVGGFRMGPFELADLIGMDINTAAARSVWAQLGKPALLTPNALQESLVTEGHLGRKTKRGCYDYSSEPPTPAIEVSRRSLALSDRARELVARFASYGAAKPGSETQNYIFARILVCIFAQAAMAYRRGVAQRDDIDTAMQFGVNYPRGPFEWMRSVGPRLCDEWLATLASTSDTDRYQSPPLAEVAS